MIFDLSGLSVKAARSSLLNMTGRIALQPAIVAIRVAYGLPGLR